MDSTRRNEILIEVKRREEEKAKKIRDDFDRIERQAEGSQNGIK